ncbi:MAG: hypothetical protein M0Z88_08300 [Actinomycetota bacterium]|nr:hypothetical protein [Actinomycetota bacterium]
MKLALAVILPLLASLVNLNSPGHYVNIGVISISVSNLLVIILMVVVFVLAVLLPFPHKKEHGA